jgi:hypothetical protein
LRWKITKITSEGRMIRSDPAQSSRLKAMGIIAFCYGIEAAWLVHPTIPVADAAAQWAAQQRAQLAPEPERS